MALLDEPSQPPITPLPRTSKLHKHALHRISLHKDPPETTAPARNEPATRENHAISFRTTRYGNRKGNSVGKRQDRHGRREGHGLHGSWPVVLHIERCSGPKPSRQMLEKHLGEGGRTHVCSKIPFCKTTVDD